MRAPLLIMLAAASWGGDAFGVWKLNPARSTLAATEEIVTVRIDPHAKGEVFTLEAVTSDGRASTSSTILYFDGKARDFEDSTCSGKQWSRHIDSRIVEIVRSCTGGGQARIIRRTVDPGLLILEISESTPDGRRLKQRLVLEKH